MTRARQQVTVLLVSIETAATAPAGVIHPDSYTQHGLGVGTAALACRALVQSPSSGDGRALGPPAGDGKRALPERPCHGRRHHGGDGSCIDAGRQEAEGRKTHPAGGRHDESDASDPAAQRAGTAQDPREMQRRRSATTQAGPMHLLIPRRAAAASQTASQANVHGPLPLR